MAGYGSYSDVIIVRNTIEVRGQVLDALSACKIIGRLGVGLDNIDLDACRKRNIQVIPAIGQNALSVAEYVIAVTMLLLRRSYFSTGLVVAGKWPRASLAEGRETSGKTIGIIGYGSIGRCTAKLAAAVGMDVVVSRRAGQDEVGICSMPIREFVSKCDVISLHLPLNAETRAMVDTDFISQMKPGAILINVSRGGVVVEPDLADALKSGHLGGAAVDVFDQEPLAPGSIWEGVPNLILTPHIAGVTKESEERVCKFVAEKVSSMLNALQASE